MLKFTTTAHKIIAIVSLLVLSSVQFFLLYNTYELKNDHYYLSEIEIIKTGYYASIRNDKIMPGGQKIVDRFVYGNMPELERLHRADTAGFRQLKQRVCDSIFEALRKANNIDSLLNSIIKKNGLNRRLEYALLVSSIDIAFESNRYVNLYNKQETNDHIDKAIQTPSGILIGGTLQDISPRNQAGFLSVSSPADHTYGASFGLHVDILNRRLTVLRLMMPTFLLSLLSILSVVLIFFITFRNWLRQKKLSEMKSDFINSITHEFHTPLAAIIVANKTMQNEKIISNKESILPLTEVVQRQSERLRVLISQVLEITTMNKIPLQKEEHSIHHLLEEILLDYRLKLSGTNAHFNLHKHAAHDKVPLDKFWFTTIFLNIFDNAIKYNNREEKEITVTTMEDRKGVTITVKDNGIGMTPEIRKHVFEKFYRNMKNNHGQVKGLGLGLFYVKQAVDAHGWKIELDSKEEEGSEFIISIPF
ncbi:HAMP domain-containing sensor histidine kinase [Flavitalea sp. BT771]|uniref:sensor histidine kinase n=1 Tax=Flavitalea sp. BT771 TaxID=3063329 RepID=UPI0026E1C024|nr:HAMP domain-containing sensor histidine kinase [Flavitalea sp. BT771]MDO6429258.1 HAMP domain-containing sensor histidine kinase [Flavitalea sp. BT771]MDV6218614.1 HAMP domain-containing sensor histidine kinase [Flavitalea sp. BT771]